jgi:hypothetical protein
MLDVDTQFTAVLARCRNTSRLSWLAILMDVLVSSMRMCLLPGASLTALIIASGALLQRWPMRHSTEPTIDHICVFT